MAKPVPSLARLPSMPDQSDYPGVADDEFEELYEAWSTLDHIVTAYEAAAVTLEEMRSFDISALDGSLVDAYEELTSVSDLHRERDRVQDMIISLDAKMENILVTTTAELSGFLRDLGQEYAVRLERYESQARALKGE
jgi:hypothetical protein